MSKKQKTANKKSSEKTIHNAKKPNGRRFASKKTPQLDFADYLALMPGLLMCVMLLLVLILDITMPEMADKQYEDFPGIFTALDYLVTAAGILYLAISVKRRELRFEKTDALFAGFALLIMISTIVNGFNRLAIDGVPYRFIGILNMFAFMLIYMGVTRSIKRESFGNVILIGYLLTADLIGLAAVYDRYMGEIEAFHGKKDLSAIFFNGNHYGYFLLMAALIGTAYYLFGTKKQAVAGAVSAGFNLILLAINHSLGCVLAFVSVFAGTAITIAIKDRRYAKKMAAAAAVLACALAAGILLSPALRKEFTEFAADLTAIIGNSADGSAGHRRLQMWTLTAEYISRKPLLGYGCEGIAFMLYDAMKVSNPHSEILTYAAYYGIPAALLYAAGVTGTITASISRIEINGVQQKAACMAAAGYFISSFVGVGMFYTLPFFFIFLGLSLKR